MARGRILPTRRELHAEVFELRFVVESQKRIIASLQPNGGDLDEEGWCPT